MLQEMQTIYKQKDSRFWARLSKTNNHQTKKKIGKQAYVDNNEKIKGKRKGKKY